jgi:hypothetical protein
MPAIEWCGTMGARFVLERPCPPPMKCPPGRRRRASIGAGIGLSAGHADHFDLVIVLETGTPARPACRNASRAVHGLLAGGLKAGSWVSRHRVICLPAPAVEPHWKCPERPADPYPARDLA